MLTWPTHLFRAKNRKMELRGISKSGGASLSGITQAARLDGGGYWAIQSTNILLRTADQIRAWRAWEVLLDGGATGFIYRLCDPRQRPRQFVDGEEVVSQTTRFDDATYFDDGTSFISVPIICTAYDAAPLRAVSMRLVMGSLHQLRGGEHFSIEHPTVGHRMYRVGTVDSQQGPYLELEDGSGILATEDDVPLAIEGNYIAITFRPPLREALVGGEFVDFNQPACVMRIADPSQMALDEEDHRRANANLTFVEHFE